MFRRNSRSRGNRASAGFTLVELLVVISIIGMLMALLLPAVQNARETGRRNTCQSNQHNLSLALMQYNDTKKYYPGWNNWLNASAATNSSITSTSANLSYAEVTYIVPLLPYLDQNPIYQNYTQYLNTLMAGTTNANQLGALGQSQVYMAILTCPSNPVQQSGSTPLAYIINGGQIDTKSTTAMPILQGGTVLGTATVGNPLQNIAAASGIAYDQTGYSSVGATAGSSGTAGTPGPIVKVTQDYVASHDGTTYTLLLSENTEALSSWSLLSNGALGSGPAVALTAQACGPVTTTTTTASQQMLTTTFMWANSGATGESVPPSSTAATTYYSINGDKGNSAAADIYHARPASAHNGVCVFSFCGGNVRPINEDIDYRTLKQLMTPFGGSSTATAPVVYNGSYDLDSITWPLDESKF